MGGVFFLNLARNLERFCTIQIEASYLKKACDGQKYFFTSREFGAILRNDPREFEKMYTYAFIRLSKPVVRNSKKHGFP